MAETISLFAESKWGCSGQYIARLVGRDPKVQFSRQFVGRKSGKRLERSEFETDEPGFFEICDVDKRGKSKEFRLILPWRDGLKSIRTDMADALKICKRLDAGEKLTDVVALELGEPLMRREYYDTCSVCHVELATGVKCTEHPGGFSERLWREVPELNDSGQPMFALGYVIRSKVEANRSQRDQSEAGIADSIVALLRPLGQAEQRRVFKAVRERITQPHDEASKPDPEPTESAPDV